MRWMPATIEIVGSVALVIFGLYAVYQGISDQTSALLLSGAVCLALGIGALVFVIRNALWHRQRLRDSDF
jgi:inner membrane protein involved in colicin E2 resistance